MEKKNKTRLARAAMTLLLSLLTTIGAWGQVNVPYTEGFENMSSADDLTAAGWELLYQSGSGSFLAIETSASYVFTGSNSLNIDAYNTGNSSDYAIVGLPVVNAAINTLQITFSYKTSGGHNVQIGYLTDANDGNTFTSLEQFDTSSSYVTKTVELNEAPATAARIAIKYEGYYRLYIDDIEVKVLPSCKQPQNLTVSGLTNQGATLTWQRHAQGTEDSWVLEYSTNSDFTSATTLNVTGNPSKALTGLTAGETYYAHVKADCGGGESSDWSTTKSFTTLCNSTTIPAEGWNENFDNYTHTSNITSVNILPDCWNYINTTSYSSYKGYPMVYYGSNYSHSGNYSLRFYSYYSSWSNYDPQDQYAILPPMEDLTGKQITLYARGYDSNSSFKIGTMTDPSDPSTFVAITEQTGLTTSYQEFSYPLSGTNTCVAIMIEAATSSRTTNSVYIDDITIDDAPSCVKPINLAVEVHGQDATLTWETGARWSEIVHSMNPGFDPNEEQYPISTDNVYTTTFFDLALGDHYFWVRSACGGDDYSEWVGPISCHIGYCTPNPTSHDSKGITGVSFGIGDYVVTNGDGSASIPASAPYYGEYSNMVGAVQAGVESTIAITTGTGNYPYTFVIWVDLDNSLSFEDNEILHIGKASAGNGTYNAIITIPATQPLGDYRMRIYGADSYFTSFYNGGNPDYTKPHDPCSEGSYRHAHDYTLRVLEAPSCLTPTGVTASDVAAHGATISWTSDADAWQILLGEEDPIDVDEATYTFTGLAAETAYSVKVRTNCGGTYSEWTNPVSFTTTVACTAPTGIAVSNIAGHSATVTWDAEEGDVFEYALAQNVDKDGNEKVPSDLQYQTVSEIPLTLTGLDPETSYTFYLRKNCGSVDGYSQSVTKTFKTTVACPAPAVTVSNITTTTAEVSCTNTEADYFNVSLDDVLIAENVTMPYTLTDLVPSTSYTVKVQAICGGEDGESAWSAGTTFMTADICPEGMVCIGTGTSTNGYLPTYTLYNYSLTQQIYTAAEIGQAGAIYSVDFYMNNTSSNTYTRNLDIYMVNTEKETFSGNTDLIPVTESDKVYSGTVTFTNNDWTTIEFDSPFVYDGNSNIVLVVDDNTGSWLSTPSFYAFSATSQAIRIYSDDTNYDPTNPPTTGNTLAVQNMKNRVRFAIGEAPACVNPNHVAVNDITTHSATISWNGTSDSYQVQYRTAETSQFVALEGSYYDGFENGLDNWTIYQEGEAGGNWAIIDPSYWGNNYTAHSGSYCVMARSWSNDVAINADNWLVSPHLTIPASMSYWVSGDSYFPETYDICVSTTGNAVADFTTVDSYNTNPDDWTLVTVDLSAYAGQIGYIAFHQYGNDKDYLWIDDVAIGDVQEDIIPASEWVTVETNDLEVLITGLEDNTTYEYQVRGYCSVEEAWSDWTIIGTFTTPDVASIHFAKEGYATYYNSRYDLLLPTGMQAKIVTEGANDGTLTYQTIANGSGTPKNVPSKTAVLLQVAPAPADNPQTQDFVLELASGTTGSYTDNKLHGSDAPTLTGADTDKYYYMLSYDTNNENIGWYWGAENGDAFPSAAHKAWLVLPKSLFQGSGAPFLGLPGWEETTGIVPVGVNPEDGEWYTLQGLKIGKKPTTAGVYIHNGRKVVIK